MNKLSYILIVFILFLLVAIGVTIYLKNKKVLDQIPDAGILETNISYSGPTVSLPNTQGSNTLVDNFLATPSVIKDEYNSDIYFLGNTFTTNLSSSDLPPYIITYEIDTGFFNIALLQEPFTISRQRAESYLKNLLQLDDAEMCELLYSVSVPGYVDDSASGIDYRFSFCPDSTIL